MGAEYYPVALALARRGLRERPKHLEFVIENRFKCCQKRTKDVNMQKWHIRLIGAPGLET